MGVDLLDTISELFEYELGLTASNEPILRCTELAEFFDLNLERIFC